MKTNPVSDFSKNLSIINELAFSIGNSLDLQGNCNAFCSLLLARKNYSFVSVWLKNDMLKNGRNVGEATCVYAYPLVMADVVTLPIDHPLFALLTHGKAISYSSLDAEFTPLIAEKRISGGAYALYPLGDYGVLKIYVQNRDEAFSAEELAQLRNVIRKFAVSVQGCLSHHSLVMAEETLRKTNLKLALLSTVTRHDILNQITAVLLYKELLADTVAAGEPIAAEYASELFKIAEIIERQIRFTGDYQEIGVEAPQWQCVCPIVKKVSQFTELSALNVTCNAGDLEIYADPLFEKVVFNLMENSIRHGSHGISMEVTWVPDNDGNIILMFADDGGGVSDENKERIFEKGFGSNTGYGLYLIREILLLTGITIKETGTLGKGATFSLTIPHGACRNIPHTV